MSSAAKLPHISQIHWTGQSTISIMPNESGFTGQHALQSAAAAALPLAGCKRPSATIDDQDARLFEQVSWLVKSHNGDMKELAAALHALCRERRVAFTLAYHADLVQRRSTWPQGSHDSSAAPQPSQSSSGSSDSRGTGMALLDPDEWAVLIAQCFMACSPGVANVNIVTPIFVAPYGRHVT